MGNHAKRIRKMPQKGKDQMQARAERKMKGMVWRGWISPDGKWVGDWKFTLAHKHSDRWNLADYAENAPFRWRIEAIARCERVDAHGKIELYVDGATATTDQRLLRDELIEEAERTMATATESTNPNHIKERVYTLTPIV